jgi:hypothetical protein
VSSWLRLLRCERFLACWSVRGGARSRCLNPVHRIFQRKENFLALVIPAPSSACGYRSRCSVPPCANVACLPVYYGTSMMYNPLELALSENEDEHSPSPSDARYIRAGADLETQAHTSLTLGDTATRGTDTLHLSFCRFRICDSACLSQLSSFCGWRCCVINNPRACLGDPKDHHLLAKGKTDMPNSFQS